MKKSEVVRPVWRIIRTPPRTPRRCLLFRERYRSHGAVIYRLWALWHGRTRLRQLLAVFCIDLLPAYVPMFGPTLWAQPGGSAASAAAWQAVWQAGKNKNNTAAETTTACTPRRPTTWLLKQARPSFFSIHLGYLFSHRLRQVLARRRLQMRLQGLPPVQQ